MVEDEEPTEREPDRLLDKAQALADYWRFGDIE